MKYKYKKGQIFGKKLHVSKEIQRKIYQNELSLIDYIQNQLDDKIPVSCLRKSDRKIVQEFGLERIKKLDWEMFYMLDEDVDLGEIFENIDSDMNKSLYEFLKDKISLEHYSDQMKKEYPNRFFDDVGTTHDEISDFKDKFNSGRATLESIVSHWDLCQEKDLSYCLLKDRENESSITDLELKEMMAQYKGLIPFVLQQENIYKFFREIRELKDEEKQEYIKSITDKVLQEMMNPRSGLITSPLSNLEYQEIFKYSSLKNYLEKQFKGIAFPNLIKELDNLPDDYVFHLPFSFATLCDFNVIRFVDFFGLKNVVDFDNENNHFFTKDNCKMLKMMYEKYLLNSLQRNKGADSNFDTRKSKGSTPFTKEEFYEAMRKMIIYGPTATDYLPHTSKPDYRSIIGPFQQQNPDLFLNDDKDEELKSRFYTKTITPQWLRQHPQYIQDLANKKLSAFFERKIIELESGVIMNWYEFLEDKADHQSLMQFIIDNQEIIDYLLSAHEKKDKISFSYSDDTLEKIKEKMKEKFIENIIVFGREYPRNVSKPVKDAFPGMFLEEDAPIELQDAFYKRKLTREFILSDPKYVRALQKVNLECVYPYMPIVVQNAQGKSESMNLVRFIQETSQEESLSVMLSYGNYIHTLLENSPSYYAPSFKKKSTKENLLNQFNTWIYQGIIEHKALLEEDMPLSFKEKYPKLFLKDDAQEELKEAFYKGEITRDFLLSHSNYMEDLRNIDLNYLYQYIPVRFEDEEEYPRNVSLTGLIQEAFQEEGLDIILLYGPYLDKLASLNATEKFTVHGPLTRESLLKQIDECLYLHIINKEITYQEDMPLHFKEKYPELFLKEDAPNSLKVMFYQGLLTEEFLLSHREYLQDLKDIDLGLIFKTGLVWVENEAKDIEEISFYKFLKQVFQEDTFDVIVSYRKYFEQIFKKDTYFITFSPPISRENVFRQIDEFLYNKILEKEVSYDENMPLHFKEKYPQLFLKETAPAELKKVFYTGQITHQFILSHPEYRDELKHIDLEYLYDISIPTKTKNGLICFENISKFIKESFKEDGLDIMILYGTYLEEIAEVELRSPAINLNSGLSPSYVLEQLNTYIYQNIVKGNIRYNENMPLYFKEKYKDMFLDQNIDPEIRRQFYDGKLSLESFEKNPHLLEELSSVNIAYGFSKQYAWIATLFQNENSLKMANVNRLKVLAECMKISDMNLQTTFQDYLESQKDIDMDKIKYVRSILSRLVTSNSLEVYDFRKDIASHILYRDDPMDCLAKIEEIFIHNNLPQVGKMFKCFQILYPDMKKTRNKMSVSFDRDSRVAPQLQDESLAHIPMRDMSIEDKRYMVIYNDMIQIAVRNCNRDLFEYLENLEQGNDLFIKVTRQDEDVLSLTTDEKNILMLFMTHVETLYHNTEKGQKDTTNLDAYTLEEKLNYLKNAFSPTERYDLKDRIVRSFAYFAGFESFEQMKNAMLEAKKVADFNGKSLGKRLESGERYQLEEGDFIRCIGNYEAFDSSLQSGNYSKEYLATFKGTSDSDTTPYDIDLTRVEEAKTIYDAIKGTPTGFGFGNIYIVIRKDNPDLEITREQEEEVIDKPYQPDKIEVFQTGYENHWGIRTGVDFLTTVDCILYKKAEAIDEENPYDANGDVCYLPSEEEYMDDLPFIKYALVKKGIYKPIIDFSGKIIFPIEEYDEMRRQVMGLSYYGERTYTFSPNLVSDEVEKIVEVLEQNRQEVQRKKDKITAHILKAVEEVGLEVRDTITSNIQEGIIDLIDTGSTSRGTNTIGDGDFDYIIRIDRKILTNSEALGKLREALIKHLNIESCPTHPDIKCQDIDLDGETVDIDISFVQKTDKMIYSSDMCLKDRLETIERQSQQEPLIDGYSKKDYVLANIILAKQVLKEAHAYKPDRDDLIRDGGMGGIGVENWILQHGGSFYDAARSFVEAAEGKSFEEFKSSYSVWDYGQNHYAIKKGEYPYNDFITDNMSEEGYERMVAACTQVLNQEKEIESPTVTDSIKK